MDYLLFFLLLIGAVLQYGAYRFVMRKSMAYGRGLVLLVFLFLYWIIFPTLLRPLYVPETTPACGMPVLGMIMFFWLFGTAIALFSHFGFCFFHIYKARKQGESKR